MRIVAGLMDGAVEDEAGAVDGMHWRAHHAATGVHLHQVVRGDLAVVQAEGVDQVVTVRLGHAHGDVVEDLFRSTLVLEHPVACG